MPRQSTARTVSRSRLFNVQSPSDFDWLEAAILTNGYYEKPGVWNLGIDSDKRMIAEMIASFEPRKALELGCAAGAVLECLAERGIDAEGVEISSMAIARATDRVRPRIHQGDLLSLELDRDYDVVFGLDVFEHLNPNRIESYLSQTAGPHVGRGLPLLQHPGVWPGPGVRHRVPTLRRRVGARGR